MHTLVEKKYLVTFILITLLFALWGFANDITNPMVAAFQTVMELSAFKASWVQFAFYGGYATMAIPAALFIRRYSYKSAILLGLGLYAIGALLFIPASSQQSFIFFCISLYILTFGLAFLETTANPFILSLGTKETSTRRLNLAQSFNPVGSIMGMAVASMVVLPQLWSDRRDEAGQLLFSTLSEAEKAAIRLHDLAVIRNPYVVIALMVILVAIVIAWKKMPNTAAEKDNAADQQDSTASATAAGKDTAMMSLGRLWSNRTYRHGVWAQMCYVGAQIVVWTFIIQYADNLGINKATAQTYNIAAMAMFILCRFISTYLMRYLNSRLMLCLFGLGAILLTLGTILCVGMAGFYCLVGISAFMSLMFPTIYGIALEKVHTQDTSMGAAFLVMAIVGGAIMPPLQGILIDQGTLLGHPAVNISFALPLMCFCVVAAYGYHNYKTRRNN